MKRLTILVACLGLAFAACGGEDDKAADSSTPAATATQGADAAQAADLEAIKTYLLEHTERLNTSVGLLQRDAQEYYNLAKGVEFDHAKLHKEHRKEVQTAIKETQGAHIQANPDYEQMEGVVAGV